MKSTNFLSLLLIGLVSVISVPNTLAQTSAPTVVPPNVNQNMEKPSSRSSSSSKTLQKIAQKYGCALKAKGKSKYCLRSQFVVFNNTSVGLIAQTAKFVKKNNKVGLGKWTTRGNPKIVITFTPEGSREFGKEYTPETRAMMVAGTLNRNLIRKGKLLSFPLSVGKINKQTVICAAPTGQCTEATMLWTLKKANRNSNITVRFLEAVKGTAGSTIFESDDDYGEETAFESIDVGNEIDAYANQQFESEDTFSDDAESTSDSDLIADSFESEDTFESENAVEAVETPDELDDDQEISNDKSFESEDDGVEFTEEDFSN